MAPTLAEWRIPRLALDLKGATLRLSRTGKPLGVFCAVSCHGNVGGARRAQALDQRGYAARRDRTGHLVIRHAHTHPAEHAADADGDLTALFGDRNDVALRLAFEAKPRPRIMKQHLL